MIREAFSTLGIWVQPLHHSLNINVCTYIHVRICIIITQYMYVRIGWLHFQYMYIHCSTLHLVPLYHMQLSEVTFCTCTFVYVHHYTTHAGHGPDTYSCIYNRLFFALTLLYTRLKPHDAKQTIPVSLVSTSYACFKWGKELTVHVIHLRCTPVIQMNKNRTLSFTAAYTRIASNKQQCHKGIRTSQRLFVVTSTS